MIPGRAGSIPGWMQCHRLNTWPEQLQKPDRIRSNELRIAYGDIIRSQPLETVTAQISYLADAIIEAAVRSAWRLQTARRGIPRLPGGQRARFAVLALGKLGGLELNYSTSAAGSIRVEIRDKDGKVLVESEDLIGDEIDGAVGWENNADISKFSGRPVRLKFIMKDADLYSMKFGK